MRCNAAPAQPSDAVVVPRKGVNIIGGRGRCSSDVNIQLNQAPARHRQQTGRELTR